MPRGGVTITDVLTSGRSTTERSPEHFAEKKIRLEQMEAMQERLEHLVEISAHTNLTFNISNPSERKNAFNMSGLLRTMTNLREQYAREIEMNQLETLQSVNAYSS